MLHHALLHQDHYNLVHMEEAGRGAAAEIHYMDDGHDFGQMVRLSCCLCPEACCSPPLTAGPGPPDTTPPPAPKHTAARRPRPCAHGNKCFCPKYGTKQAAGVASNQRALQPPRDGRTDSTRAILPSCAGDGHARVGGPQDDDIQRVRLPPQPQDRTSSAHCPRGSRRAEVSGGSVLLRPICCPCSARG